MYEQNFSPAHTTAAVQADTRHRMNNRRSAAELAEEWSATASASEIASADKEIYELGLSEPALCCCEYSEASSNTGGNHISHHFCDCKRLEDALVRLCSTCCTDSSAWRAIFNQIQRKSLLPFPGGAVKVPIELWCGAFAYLLFRTSKWYGYLEKRSWHAAFATTLLVVLMEWINRVLAKRKIRSDLFFSWFLVSVLHNVMYLWENIFHQGTTYPLSGSILLALGFLMLVCLLLTRRYASFAHTKYVRSLSTSSSSKKRGMETLRSKHCFICNSRSEVFDHHCTFINCCVSEDNHVLFLSFAMLASLILAMLVLTILSQDDWSVITGTTIYNAMILPFVSGLTIFQLYLVSKGMTTREFLKVDPWSSPFDRGIIMNWTLFLTGKRRSEKMHVERRRMDEGGETLDERL